MATRVFLARHGEVENHASGVYNGRTDVGITRKGREQMKTVLEKVRDQGISAVYCSTLSRTVEGAELISSALGLDYETLPEIRERNFGEWEGLTDAGIRERYPELYETWKEDVTTVRPPEGETLLDVSERVLKVLGRLVEKHRGEAIVIVAHGGVNRVILAEALKIEMRHIFRIDQSYGCLNIIDYYDDGFAQVKLVNG